MRKELDDVIEFNIGAGRIPAERPQIPATIPLSGFISNMVEELAELKEAARLGNPVEILDAFVDLQYYLLDFVVMQGYGEVLEEGFTEVHRSNMTKFDPVTGKGIFNEVGKLLKGPNYQPPNLGQIIAPYMPQPVNEKQE